MPITSPRGGRFSHQEDTSGELVGLVARPRRLRGRHPSSVASIADSGRHDTMDALSRVAWLSRPPRVVRWRVRGKDRDLFFQSRN